MMRSHLDYCLQKEASIYYYTGTQVKSRTRLQLIHSNMKPNFSSISTRMPVRLDPSSNISTDRLCLAVLLAWRLPPCGGEHGLRPESFLLHRREQAAMSMDEGTSSNPHASEFALLVETTVSKMLPFVDAIIAAATRTSDRPEALAAAEKLQLLIDASDALSMASERILPSLSSSSPCIESTDGMMGLGEHLSTELAKLDEAIWDTMVDIRTGTLAWMQDNGGSSDIHRVTHSIISYTKVLWPITGN